MEHQYHYGKKFYLDKKTGYWISTTRKKIRAHVWVWTIVNGKISKGYHIHHIDGNKSNNDISNLQMIGAFEHLSYHSSQPNNAQRSREWCDKIRPLTKEWHASEEGRKWHKYHGIECWKKRESIDVSCRQCHKITVTKTYHQEFCSNNCKSKWRRDQGVDDIDCVCPVCQCTFRKNKYKKNKTCGRKCGGIFKSKEYRGRRE